MKRQKHYVIPIFSWATSWVILCAKFSWWFPPCCIFCIFYFISPIYSTIRLLELSHQRKGVVLMVYASIKSREKVFHLPHCKIHTRINRDYRIAFDTPDQARAAGYRMCNCCSSMGLRLRKEQKAIDAFCEKNKLRYLLWDGDLIDLNDIGSWVS